MSLSYQKILAIPVTTDSKEKILEELKKYLNKTEQKSSKPIVICTPNPEQIMLSQRDPEFAKILKGADVSLPDGIGLLWAGRVLSGPAIPERIPGIEMMEALATLAAKEGVLVGLIGGRGGVAVKALECLRTKHKGLKGWAVEPEGQSVSLIAKKIRQTDAGIIFVGLGAPKQEYFIENLKGLLQKQKHIPVILMSVGGAFDVISGSIQRAPVLIRLINLEWLWRLFLEPWRWRRQLALGRFVVLVLRRRFSAGRLS